MSEAMLHLVNGKCTAESLEKSGVAGEIVSADDLLTEGPLIGALDREEEWAARADYLDASLGIPRADYIAGSRKRDALIARAANQEAVLWFEEDLFCQINSLQALQRIAAHTGGAAPRRLSYVCPPEERLGQVSSERLAELFEQRVPVSSALLELAVHAWQGFIADRPEPLEALLDAHDATFEAWPSLRNGVKLQLERLPGGNGLNRIETVVLESIARGATSFITMFPRFCRVAHGYGFGDLQVMHVLLGMANAPTPLLSITGDPVSLPADPSGPPNWRLQLTESGEAVLAGELDWVELGGVCRWVGGMWLEGRGVPRWTRD